MTSKGSEKMTQLTIGVDIAKDHLDAACFTTGREGRFPNDAGGLKALRRWIGPAAPSRDVYEPTGRFHVGLEQAFAGWPLVKVNPLQARRFAEACGTRAKTDAVDARMLARMGPSSICHQTPWSLRSCASCASCRRRAPASCATASP